MIKKIDLSITSDIGHGDKTQYRRVLGLKGFASSIVRTKISEQNARKYSADYDNVLDYTVGNSKSEFSVSDTYTVRIQNKEYAVKVNIPIHDRSSSQVPPPKTVLESNIPSLSGALSRNNRISKRRQWKFDYFANYTNFEPVDLLQSNRHEISHKYVLHIEKLSTTVLENLFPLKFPHDRYTISSPLTPSLIEPVESEFGDLPEAHFNVELHTLEGVDMTQFSSPDQDRAVKLNEWPRHLRATPYKV